MGSASYTSAGMLKNPRKTKFNYIKTYLTGEKHRMGVSSSS